MLEKASIPIRKRTSIILISALPFFVFFLVLAVFNKFFSEQFLFEDYVTYFFQSSYNFV